MDTIPYTKDSQPCGAGVPLNQCFSTGVPRNPGVQWASLKGSAEIMFPQNFTCFPPSLVDFNWKDGSLDKNATTSDKTLSN